MMCEKSLRLSCRRTNNKRARYIRYKTAGPSSGVRLTACDLLSRDANERRETDDGGGGKKEIKVKIS